ncbi:MAG: type II secretion system minor pseudopilin GspI [Proteobacteria bacterium]|nr:type II secretion system minor pseudopilin GspI [Pseudomonadota bacterium]
MIKSNGFTLVEVLIALVIVSLVFFTCLLSLSEMTKNAQYLQDKTIGAIIGSNIIVQVRTGMISTNQDITEGAVQMANQQWFWSLQKNTSSLQGEQELKVEIKNSHSKRVYLATGFMYEKAKLQ